MTALETILNDLYDAARLVTNRWQHKGRCWTCDEAIENLQAVLDKIKPILDAINKL